MIRSHELAKALLAAPDKVVIQSKDSEGNDFSPYSDFSFENYFPENSWSGSLVSSDEAVPESAIPVIVLWPIN